MTTKAKNIKNKWKLLSVIIFVIILDLFFLYYVKYKNQGLPLNYFNFAFIGNLLNLLFTAILITGIVLYSFSKKNIYNPGLLIFYTSVMTLILLFSEFYSLAKIPIPNYYILEHPLKEVLKGLIFSLYQLVQFIFISVVWLSFLGRKELLILRAVINSIVLTTAVLLIAFLYLSFNVESKLVKIQAGNSPCVGVVMGAAVWSNNRPSPSLAARADRGAELYKDGIISKIQLTGGHAPGELSEAEVAFDYLKAKDINPADIWIEKRTASTSDQIKFIKNDLIQAKHLKDIIIISDSYHLARIKEICNFYKIKAQFAASEMNLSIDKRIYYKIRESIALIVFWLFAL